MKPLKFLWYAFIAAAITVGLMVCCSSKAADSTDVPQRDGRVGGIRAGGSMEAKPAPSYELILGIYSVAKGHTVQWRSYRDVIRVPGYTDYDTCAAAADYAQQHFEGRPDPATLSQDLLDAVCTAVRP